MIKSRLVLVWAIVATIVAIVGTGTIVAQGSNSGNVIYAAYQNVTGNLRLITSPSDAKPSESVISWNQVGPQGPAGVAGAAGAVGAAGPQGTQGLKGDTGATGPAGVAGPTGPQGLKGDTGAAGAAGLDGGVGPAGAQGIQGLKGDAGAAGAAGPAGPAGVAGATGPAGAVGPAGPQGPSGNSVGLGSMNWSVAQNQWVNADTDGFLTIMTAGSLNIMRWGTNQLVISFWTGGYPPPNNLTIPIKKGTQYMIANDWGSSYLQAFWMPMGN